MHLILFNSMSPPYSRPTRIRIQGPSSHELELQLLVMRYEGGQNKFWTGKTKSHYVTQKPIMRF